MVVESKMDPRVILFHSDDIADVLPGSQQKSWVEGYIFFLTTRYPPVRAASSFPSCTVQHFGTKH